jgi:putative transposase
MPGKARLLLSSTPHPIVQRGHNRKAVFLADEDYPFYLDNLKKRKIKLDVKRYARCWVTNHIHLLLEPGNDASTVSELMKRLVQVMGDSPGKNSDLPNFVTA